MSSIDTRPPQTYSRLFRPWDSKIGNENIRKMDKMKNNNNNNDLVAIQKDNFEEILRSAQIAANTAGFNDHHNIQYPLDMTNSNNPFEITQLNDFYLTNGLRGGNIFGVDQVAVSLMEQEYVRVMTEDAHIKALNSRKQRPKKFKCPHCDVAFSNNGQLKGHIRIHTGERPFKCDDETCGKTFTRNEELTRHKRIHTGLRPFGCSSCGKKFGRRDHLKKHMKTHIPQERQLGSAIFVPMYPYLYGY